MLFAVNRQPNVQQQQPNVVPAHQTNAAGTQPLLGPNNMMVQRLQFVYNNNGPPYYSSYSQHLPYGYYPVPAHPQNTDTSGYAIPINSIPSNSHLQNHRQPPHQQMAPSITMAPPNMNQFMIQQMQRPKDQAATKRPKNPLPIVDPRTNKQINMDATDRNNSGSNTHSSALKIEAPLPVHPQGESQNTQPPNSRTMPSAQSTSDGSAILLAAANETEQTTCKSCPVCPSILVIDSMMTLN